MAMISIGDLAQSYMLRQRHTDLKTRMNSLVEELSSGRTADVARHLSGSYSYLADVERNLTLLQGYDTATAETVLFTDGMQRSLENFQDLATGLGLAALSASNAGLSPVIQNTSARAREDFTLMVNALNTEVAGRSLFSGVASDTTSLATAGDILTELRTLIAGETDIAGVAAQLDTWFDTPGGGFETFAYQGATQSLAPLQLSAGETVSLDLRADDSSIRVLLKHAAMGALAADPSLAFPETLQKDMIQAAGEGLTLDQQGLVRIRADLGYVQARAEESAARIASERTSYEIARTELLSVDPFATATSLEEVQYQLEALYAVTVKLSRLSLTEFL